MKKIAVLLMALIGVFGFTSCMNSLDNYDEPDGGIRGTILDAETNEPIPLPVQGSNGVIINMYELNTNATRSVDFRAKQDGTYENSRMFNCDYRIVVNGPFVGGCEDQVTVHGQTTKDLKATPYARIKATASLAGHVATINYTVTPTDASFTVSNVSAFWNFAPGVDNSKSNYAGKTSGKDLTGTFTIDLDKENEFASNLYKINANGGKIYLRVSATTEGKVNYSTVMEVTVK